MRKPRGLELGDLRASVKASRGTRKTEEGVAWYWVARTKGRDPTYRSMGWLTRHQATLELARLVQAGDLDVDEDDGDQLDNMGTVLRAWLYHVENERPDLSPATAKQYRMTVGRLVARIGAVDPARATPATWRQVVTLAARANRSTQTTALDLRVLGIAWRWARERGFVPDRDIALPKLKVSSPDKYTPTPDEIRRVIGVVERPWTNLFLRVAFATGGRVGEISRIAREDVDRDRGRIRLSGKTGPRWVPVRPDLAAELLLYADPRKDNVFGVTYNSSTKIVGKLLRAACDACDVPRFTVHGIRRAAADELLRAGVDVATAAAILGHSPAVLLRVYRRPSESDKQRAIRAARLGSMASPSEDEAAKK